MITVETSNRCATVKLNRPDALNALTPEVLRELANALEVVAANDDVDVVVFTGEGRAFCAGVDLKALQSSGTSGGDVSSDLNTPARRCTELLSAMGAVTIAKVHGPCFTGGLELALACDIMIVADEAKMGDTHTKWGLRPTWGMSQRLVQAVGITRARWLSYTARTFFGRDAAAWGMAALSVPLVDIDTRTDELVAEILANSPSANRAYKDLYRNAQNHLLDDGLSYEYGATYSLGGSAERLKTFGS